MKFVGETYRQLHPEAFVVVILYPATYQQWLLIQI